MPIDPKRTCPECGAEQPAGSPAGQCPNCLLGLGLIDAGHGSEIGDQRITHHASLVPDFGDYELLEKIGHGGMGVVYKARQKSLDRIVALKLLLFGPHAPPDLVKRFRAEAVATAAMQHPNIVAIHEVGTSAGQHFLVMDYIEGSSLAKILGSQPLAGPQAARYVKTIAEAIHYAHERGLLHRDLKPSNILVDANDQPRVTDFGLARRLEGDSELTATGQVLGSPNYMPPEQASGKRATLSRRSDVYALGAILYHALTGRPPFVGEGLAETVQQVMNVEPVSPRVLNPRLPADLETVCLKCLEKEPAKRYPTAQALAEDLERFLKDQPVLARPIGPAGKAWRWCQRQPVRAGLIAALMLVFALGIAGVLWQWRSARLHAQRESMQRQRAEAGELIARRNEYAADMKEVQRALEETDLGRARELLDRHRPPRQSQSSTFNSRLQIDLRGWEWRYLWTRCRSDERFTLCQYSKAVSALGFSPDGKWLAVRGLDETVVLWDTLARRPVTNLAGAGLHRALALSPTGTLLAWGNEDANGTPMVSLWDVSAQKEIARFPHSHAILSIAFSCDAKQMAALAFNGTVRLWHLESRHVIADFPTSLEDGLPRRYSAVTNAAATEPVWSEASQNYGCVVFSPNGRLLVVGEAKRQIRLLDRVTDKETVIRLPPPADGITALAISPDSKLLAAGCGHGTDEVYVWDLAAGTNVTLTGHSGWITGLAFSPDGQTLASVSTDHTLRLWDVARKAERRRFQGHTEEVWALAWSPDGNNLVTGAKDGTVRYWDPATKPPAAYVVLPVEIRSWGLAFLPDSKTFLTATRTEGAVVSWDAATLQRENLPFLGTNHFSMDLSRDGRWLALSATNRNIQVWDFRASRLVTNLVFPEAWIFAAVFSPRSGHLHCGAAVSGGFDTKIWTVADWHEVSLQGINRSNFRELDFSPDERTVAIGYNDGTAAWWDIVTRERQAIFNCQDARNMRVRFSPDGRWFAAAGENGRMTLCDVLTRQATPIGRSYRSGLHDLVFSPDGQRLITTGTSPKDLVKLWDVETGRDVATLPGAPGRLFHHIGFSPDGNTLFANSREGLALLWHAPSWEEIEAIEKKQKAP